MSLFSNILSLSDFLNIRNNFTNVICTSGGFDPLHAGHISSFFNSKNLNGTLVVLVNDDSFLLQKKGYRLMPHDLRCQIVASIRYVDYVIPFSQPKADNTVSSALIKIRPNIFTKGGDRVDKNSIPEWDICQQIGTSIILQTDDIKYRNSSSQITKDLFTSLKMKD